MKAITCLRHWRIIILVLVVCGNVYAAEPSLYRNGCVALLDRILHQDLWLDKALDDGSEELLKQLGPEEIVCFKGNDLERDYVRRIVADTKAVLCLNGEGLALKLALKRDINPRKIRVYAAIPKNATEIKASFSKYASTNSVSSQLLQTATEQMRRATEIWPKDAVLDAKPGIKMKERISQAISNTHSDGLAIIFAHNEDGELRFPDGSKLRLAELGKFNADQPMPLILSCETYLSGSSDLEVRTLRRLDYEDTGLVVSKALDRLSQFDGRPSMRTVLAIFEDEFQQVEAVKENQILRVRIAFKISATSGLTLLTVVVSKQSKQPDSTHRKTKTDKAYEPNDGNKDRSSRSVDSESR